MKLKGINKKHISYSLPLIGVLSTLISSQGYAGAMGPVDVSVPGKVYASVFGGGGEFSRVDISQFGTAFFSEANGGPLAVDAFGKTKKRSVGLVGGHVGYQWPEIVTSFSSLSGITPAIELEGYYLGKSKFKGHDINNDTIRLPEHDFAVTYPTKTGVFLTNAVLNFNLSNLNRFHPYVGAGFGGAILSISNAKALQVSPPELGVNHYNAHTSDTESTFAAQAKAGLNADLTKNISIFAEYRYLYLTKTKYAFGSTVYPGHAPTSHWQVKLGSQNYNLGAVGIQVSV